MKGKTITLLPGSVCAVAADTNYVNTVWFVKILEELIAEEDVVDDYGQKVNKGFAHFKGHYMEETKSVKDGCFYKVDQKKKTFFFKERIVYPFIIFQERKNGLFLLNTDLVDILNYVEENGLTAL